MLCNQVRIPNIESKRWPALNPKSLFREDSKEEEVRCIINADYYGKIGEGWKIDESNIFQYCEYDLQAFVTYRITRPLKDGVSLPKLNQSQLFNRSRTGGFTVEVSPNYSYAKNDEVISLDQEQFAEIESTLKELKDGLDSEILDIIETTS